MTSSHVIYIPMVVFAGMMLGFILGTRAAKNAADLQARRDRERADAKAEREARKAKRKAESPAADE